MRGLWALAVLAIATPARANAESRAPEQAPAPTDSVGLVVQGSAGFRGRLEVHLTEQLRREGFLAVEKPLSRDALNTLVNCLLLEDLTCARGVVEARAKTARMLYVTAEENGAAVTIDLVWFSAGSQPLTEHVACESCSETFAGEVTAPVHHLASAAPAPKVVEPEPAPPPPEGQSSRFWPTTLLVGGAVTAVAGGVSLYYGLRDDASHKYVYPQLTPIGITLLAVGAGAAIGAYILMPAGKPRSHPVGAVSSGGAYVGWVREF